ncbi:LysR family transcriptional regulator [Paenibacillus kandeliae]|uniref:LysR family transcriptional regulator n=1 Tax=Paenibacillus kandeliae TaxID=3231269 RepID=UPI003459DBFE
MNIENMEAFVYIHHYGSFNKAAEILFLSQPSVTARIQSLERELGCKLFERLGRQIVLTEEGRRFLPYAQQVLQVLQKGRQRIQTVKTTPEELTIGCTISVSNYVIPELLPQLKQQYPQTNFKLITATTDQLVSRLLNKEIDIGFVRKMMHPSIRTVSSYEDPISLYVYADHPFAYRPPTSISALERQQLVFFECGSLDWLRIHRVFEAMESPPEIAFQVDHSETAKKLVLQKAGIAFLPGLSVHEEVKQGKLVRVALPEIEGISLQTSLVTLKEQPAHMTSMMADLLRDVDYFRRQDQPEIAVPG